MLRRLLLVAILIAAAPIGHAAELRDVQQALVDKGYDPGPIDGLPGRRTTAALKAFQAASGLNSTGEADDDTLRLLGLLEAEAAGAVAAAPEPVPEPVAEPVAEPEPVAAPTPIQGDLTAAMELFGLQAAAVIMQEFSGGTGIPVITTEGFPLSVEFVAPDPGGKWGSASVEGTDYAAEQISVVARDLNAKPAISFALELFTQPGLTLPAPDDLCADMPVSNIGIPVTHICITGGAIEFGGKIKGVGNDVSCARGGLKVTNANRTVEYVGDADCTVNGNAVQFRDGVWSEVSG